MNEKHRGQQLEISVFTLHVKMPLYKHLIYIADLKTYVNKYFLWKNSYLAYKNQSHDYMFIDRNRML